MAVQFGGWSSRSHDITIIYVDEQQGEKLRVASTARASGRIVSTRLPKRYDFAHGGTCDESKKQIVARSEGHFALNVANRSQVDERMANTKVLTERVVRDTIRSLVAKG